MKVAVTAALLLLVGCGFAFFIAPDDRPRARVAWFVIGTGTAGFSYRLWCSVREMNRRRRDGSNRK